jgi:two-component system chemotaxis response regulator CheB
MSAKHRVLVVDDSAFARKVVREILTDSGRFEVVGIARDGLEALEAIAELAPDVVTLDLVMPELDGIGVLDALGEGGPPVVVVSISGSDTQMGAAALLRGAVDIVEKPATMATDRLYEMRDELLTKVGAAVGCRMQAKLAAAPPVSAPASTTDFNLIMLGASTGGPRAIGHVVTSLPAGLPVPVVAAIHIPEGYTKPLAERLNAEARLPVTEGRDGALLEPGKVTIAPGGYQSEVVGSKGRLRLAITKPTIPPSFTPSIDLLFASAARAGSPILAAVLTGMGNDGTEGARAIRAAGGVVLTESESTCAVYGMPRSVVEAGLADGVVPLDRVAEWLVNHLGR